MSDNIQLRLVTTLGVVCDATAVSTLSGVQYKVRRSRHCNHHSSEQSILSSLSLSLSGLYHVNISVSCLQLDNFHWMIYPELVTRNVASGGIRMELP